MGQGSNSPKSPPDQQFQINDNNHNNNNVIGYDNIYKKNYNNKNLNDEIFQGAPPIEMQLTKQLQLKEQLDQTNDDNNNNNNNTKVKTPLLKLFNNRHPDIDEIKQLTKESVAMEVEEEKAEILSKDTAAEAITNQSKPWYDGMMNDDNHTFISYESNSSIQSLQRILTTNVDKDNNINDYNTHNNLSSSASIA